MAPTGSMTIPSQRSTVNVGVRPHHAHQRSDHRWPGHHRHRADQRRQLRREIQQPPAGEADDQKGNQHADGDQIAHHAAEAAYLLETQRQRPFKQDDRHR